MIAVARISIAAFAATLGFLAASAASAAPTTAGASTIRGDRLSAAAGDTVVETITVEARAANMSTLTRVPVSQR